MLALRRKPPFEIAVCDPPRTRSVAPRSFVISIVLAVARAWRERARQRWELSQMSARDFADLRIPFSLAADEARRWPWQDWSPQWRETDTARRNRQ